MKKDLIQKTLGKQIRIVLECPYTETMVPEGLTSYINFTCNHPNATYRVAGKESPGICGVVERLNGLESPIFKGAVNGEKKFVCPYNKVDENFARGIQTRKVE